MGDMRVPSFTAEASLYRTSNYYALAAGGGSLDGRAYPQMNEVERMFVEWLLESGGGGGGGGSGGGFPGGCVDKCRSEKAWCEVGGDTSRDCSNEYNRCIVRCWGGARP